MRRHLFILGLSILIPSLAMAEPDSAARTIQDVAWQQGKMPDHCVAISADRQWCSWPRANDAFLTCLATREDGRLTGDTPCLSAGANLNTMTWRTEGNETRGKGWRQRLSEEARRSIEAVETLQAMVEFIGQGPNDCLFGSELLCRWQAIRATPGYIALARAADEGGKKLSVLCRFSADDHAALDCKISAIGKTETVDFDLGRSEATKPN